MSDLHLTKDGCPIWETNTMEHFNQSIDIIRGMQNIDVILVTGDISDVGSEWTHQYADRLYSTLGIPTLCCPGNHDSLKMMLCEYKPSCYQVLPHSCTIEGWKLVMLNSVVSADDIKKHLDGFSMNNPQLVHEESVQLAKQLVYLFALA